MKSFLAHPATQWALRLGLAAVFLYAGSVKITHPQAFADSIATFQLLPAQWINLLALSLPPFEIVIGAALLIGWRQRPAALGVLVMTVVFAGALSYAIVKGLSINCGCFGDGVPSPLAAWKALGRDVLLFLGGLALYASVHLTAKGLESEVGA